MASCVSEPDLRAYLLGELPERVGDYVTDHLSSCAACDAVAGQFDCVTDLVIDILRRTAPSAGTS